MKKWYKAAWCKALLVFLTQAAAVILCISLVWMAMLPGNGVDAVRDFQTDKYENTNGFSSLMESQTQTAFSFVSDKSRFETEGKYDDQKLVDLVSYRENDKITGKNTNGIAYKIKDLKAWSKSYQEAYQEFAYGSDYTSYNSSIRQNIVVCKRADGTYYYYALSDFVSKVRDKELSFVGDLDGSEKNLTEQYISELTEGKNYSSTGEYRGILDADDKILYVDFWSLENGFKEDYLPDGGKSLMEIANTDPRWNGKLSDAFNYLDSVLLRFSDDVHSYSSSQKQFKPENTNFMYLIVDHKNQIVYTNREEFSDYSQYGQNIDAMKKMGKYLIKSSNTSENKTNLKGEAPSRWTDAPLSNGSAADYIYAVAVDTSFPAYDQFYKDNLSFGEYAPYFGLALGGAIASTAVLLICLIWLTIVTGRSNQEAGVVLNGFDRIKTEIAAAIVVAVLGIVINVAVEIYGVPAAVVAGILAFCGTTILLIGYLSLIRRIKARTLWKDSLVRWMIQPFKRGVAFCVEVFRHRSCTFKIVAIYGSFILLHWITMASGFCNGFFVFLCLIFETVCFYFLLRAAISRQKIREGIKRVANGEVDYKIPLKGLKGDQLEMAEQLNRIGEGLDAAVEESMKSERLKTDLITNVSHDIKTPLTSIISYVDLLKRENFDDPKIRGYLDILEAKAQRLKTLTEDVVEASKVSTGNIKLERMNLNLIEMIHQTNGEFAERFEKRNLTMVMTMPEQSGLIYADGRRMWRILENVFNNAAKYAMEGTRIYGDVILTDQTVEFSLKNISEQPLNIDASELTERFIRGDVSRSTEGSGLGLSIAKSLTDIQGGRFDLYVDGDLFKVIITFPRVKPNEE